MYFFHAKTNQFCIYRCIFTNINPKTAQRNPAKEPLTTLKKNRSYLPGESPVLGTHISLRSPGKVFVGDAVYVEA